MGEVVQMPGAGAVDAAAGFLAEKVVADLGQGAGQPAQASGVRMTVRAVGLVVLVDFQPPVSEIQLSPSEVNDLMHVLSTAREKVLVTKEALLREIGLTAAPPALPNDGV